MRTIAKIIVTACVSGLLPCLLPAQANEVPIKVGSAPPPLKLATMVQGPKLEEISWDKLKGQVVVLEFWDTGCGPCIQAIPHLNELVNYFKGKPVVFISISDDNEDHLKQFLKKHPLTSWVAVDGPFWASREPFQFSGIPDTVVVDPAGEIAAITHPMLLKTEHIASLLAGRPAGLPVITNLEPGVVKEPVASSPGPEPQAISVKITGPFPRPDSGSWGSRGWEATNRFTAKKAELADVFASFFDISPNLIIPQTKLPESLYDVSASAPAGQMDELKRRFIAVLETNFNLTVQTDRRVVAAYSMTICSNQAPGLKPAQIAGGGGSRNGGLYFNGVKIKTVAGYLEGVLGQPVIDETSLTGLWAVDFKWKMSWQEQNFDSKPEAANVIQAAHEQLGLDLKPVSREMTVFEVKPVQ